MKQHRCELEAEILRATKTAGISDAVRQHLAECELCRNTVAADAWMKEFATAPLIEKPLPDPTLIWLKSQLLQSEGALFHLRQSMTTLQTIAFGLVALAWAVLISWKWSALDALLHRFDGSGAVVAVLDAQLVSLPFVFTIVILTCATLALAFHSAFAE